MQSRAGGAEPALPLRRAALLDRSGGQGQGGVPAGLDSSIRRPHRALRAQRSEGLGLNYDDHEKEIARRARTSAGMSTISSPVDLEERVLAALDDDEPFDVATLALSPVDELDEEDETRGAGLRRRGGRRRRGRGARARGRGALERFAAALPARHRPHEAAHRRPGDRARQARRARRHARQAAHDRGQHPPRRLDREALPRAGPAVPRPDPGGDDRPRARGGEVRLPARLQVLDLRDLVDPPGRRALARRQGPHDPHARARRREAEPHRPRRAQAAHRARPRPHDRGDRRARRAAGRGGRADHARRADADLAREAGRRRGRLAARALHRRRHDADGRGRGDAQDAPRDALARSSACSASASAACSRCASA